MKKTKDYLQKLIIEMAKAQINQLKPSIKEKVIFRFSDEIIETKMAGEKAIFRATISQAFNPAIITLYTSAIRDSLVKHLWRDLNDIITHELTHLFTKDNEPKTNEQCVKMDFFKQRSQKNNNLKL